MLAEERNHGVFEDASLLERYGSYVKVPVGRFPSRDMKQ
jgi:hypothetical protein